MAVLKEITEEPVILFGFSDGAYTSYKVAAMYPDRVERVVAIGAGTLQPGYFPPDMKVEDLEKADKAFMDNFDVTWAAMKPFVYADVNTLRPSKKVIMK